MHDRRIGEGFDLFTQIHSVIHVAEIPSKASLLS